MNVLFGARVEGAAMPMMRAEAKEADASVVVRVEKRMVKEGFRKKAVLTRRFFSWKLCSYCVMD